MSKIKVAGGVGDSKVFAAPEGTFVTGVDRILDCHINQVLISEMNLDPQILSALDYWATDEGIKEKADQPGPRASGITVGDGPFEKALSQRRDDVKYRDIPMYESRDPLKEVADRYAVPGMSPKFLSARRVRENGGTGDYQVVKTKEGDPVMVKGMILGHTPTEVAKARSKRFQDHGNNQLKQMTQKYKREGGATAALDPTI